MSSLGGVYNLSMNGGGMSHSGTSLLGMNTDQSQCSGGAASANGLHDLSMSQGNNVPGGADDYSLKNSVMDCSIVNSQSSCSKIYNSGNNENFDSIKNGSTSSYGPEFPSNHHMRNNSGEISGANQRKTHRVDLNGIPDDSKLLANPKGIIKSYLPQAAAHDSLKFDAYRELCMAHSEEYYKSQKDGAAAVMCHICNNSQPSWNTLQRHLQTHIDFRPFNCDKCDRTFYSQGKLKRHQLIHSDAKPFKCPVCDKRLARTEHLKRHLVVHTEDRPYGCSTCPHTSKRLDGIRRHIKRKHGVNGAEIIIVTGSRGDEVGVQDINQVISAIQASERQQQQQSNPSGVDGVVSIVGGAKKKKKKPKKKLIESHEGGKDVNMSPPGVGCAGNVGSIGSQTRPSSQIPLSKDVKSCQQQQAEPTGNTTAAHSRVADTAAAANTAATIAAAAAAAAEEMKPAWDGGLLLGGLQSQQMQLLYHSLARSHPVGGPGIHDGVMSAAPCNLSTNDAGMGLRQGPFCGGGGGMGPAGGLGMGSADHTFIMNGAGVPMRYFPGMESSAGNPRHVNPMLFSPRNTGRNLGHFAGAEMNMAGGAEAMISQYIQSQQRFAPPMWGFANHNYHNY